MAGVGGGAGGSTGAGVGGVAAAGFHHSRAPSGGFAGMVNGMGHTDADGTGFQP